MQKIFCDLCEAEVPGWSGSRTIAKPVDGSVATLKVILITLRGIVAVDGDAICDECLRDAVVDALPKKAAVEAP